MDVAAKLQLRDRRIRLVGAPPGLKVDVPMTTDESGALLVFATTKAALRPHEPLIVSAAKADRLTWVAYPKGGQLGTDLNRDILWKHFAPEGIRPVRNVSLDAIWSALRFRPG